MKKALIGMTLLAAAGCVCTAPVEAEKPVETATVAVAPGKDPAAPYDDYGPAMASEKGNPMAVEWHNQNAAALDAAVKDDVLAAFVKDDASAKALLAQVKDAYQTDAKAAIQIAAVTQWVMAKPDARKDARMTWTKALMATAENAKCDYVKLFCLDQVRWCGCPCPKLAARVEKLGKASSKPVADMADLVVRGLKK